MSALCPHELAKFIAPWTVMKSQFRAPTVTSPSPAGFGITENVHSFPEMPSNLSAMIASRSISTLYVPPYSSLSECGLIVTVYPPSTAPSMLKAL